MTIKLKHKEPDSTANDYLSCSCGNHFGKGIWTAEHRAKVYAWFRDVYRSGFSAERKKWLASYEMIHGRQTSNHTNQQQQELFN